MLMFFRTIAVVNSSLLWVGRQLAWVALALMVTVILAQVFFRYVLNNALPWPDEAARFLMLWMTALIAPAAFRTGGFVSITMLADLIGKRLAQALSCILLALTPRVPSLPVPLKITAIAFSFFCFESDSKNISIGRFKLWSFGFSTRCSLLSS